MEKKQRLRQNGQRETNSCLKIILCINIDLPRKQSIFNQDDDPNTMIAYVLLCTGHSLIYFYTATAIFNRHGCETNCCILPGERDFTFNFILK